MVLGARAGQGRWGRRFLKSRRTRAGVSLFGSTELSQGRQTCLTTQNPVATPQLDLYSRGMATEDENPSQPDITALLKDQTSACKAARAAIAGGGEVMLYDGQPPQWMVLGIAATRLRRSLRIGLTTLGLDESVEILRALHRDERLRTGNIVPADRSWFFTLYFDATGTELLACSAVKNERPSRGDGHKLQR